MLTNTITGNASGPRTASPGSISLEPRGDAQGSKRSASYMLDGRDGELRSYIDHKVEVTGTLEPHIDEPNDSNSTPTRGSNMTHGRDTGLQWLHVASVKAISSDCSAK